MLFLKERKSESLFCALLEKSERANRSFSLFLKRAKERIAPWRSFCKERRAKERKCDKAKERLTNPGYYRCQPACSTQGLKFIFTLFYSCVSSVFSCVFKSIRNINRPNHQLPTHVYYAQQSPQAPPPYQNVIYRTVPIFNSKSYHIKSV